MSDPFAEIPAATSSECKVVARPARTKVYVDPLGDSSKKRKQTNLNPMQQRWFERHGWQYQKTEWRDPSFKRHDLWTFGDWIACDEHPGSVIVQTCIRSDMTTRLRKAEAATELRRWLERSNRFEVHGWEKVGRFWQVRRTQVVLRAGELAREVVGVL